LICWRSSPLAQPKRQSSEATAARPAASMSGNAMRSTTTNSTADVPSSPELSGHTSAGPLSGQRIIAPDTLAGPTERPPSQAIGRHQREGARPSGNRRGTNTRIRPRPGAQIHCASQEVSAARGSEPGLVSNPYVAYSNPKFESP
jgi:hypothetical protein